MDMEKTGKRIRDARVRAKLSQDDLAKALYVSPQAISKWENGWNLPALDKLMPLCETLNLPLSVFLDEEETETMDLTFRDRLFSEKNMYSRLKAAAQAEGLSQTYRALDFMRVAHSGQYRKPNRYSSEPVEYINHPLMMACHAHAMKIKDDDILSAILLHDVVEDTAVSLDDLLFSDRTKDLIERLTKKDGQDKEDYYEKILENPDAALIKCIDRCNNLSTMAGSFTGEKMEDYIVETERYILPLLDRLKTASIEYSDAAFLLKYQIISQLESTKYLLQSRSL